MHPEAPITINTSTGAISMLAWQLRSAGNEHLLALARAEHERLVSGLREEVCEAERAVQAAWALPRARCLPLQAAEERLRVARRALLLAEVKGAP
jgi:hypothetical protein